MGGVEVALTLTGIIVGLRLEWGGFGYALVVRLFRRCLEVKRVREFWYMEVPSCTEWKINSAMVSFNPNCYVEVGKEGVDAKVKALSMYRGVMRPYPHPRSAEFIEGLAAYRGGQWGLMYAEAFEVVMREY